MDADALSHHYSLLSHDGEPRRYLLSARELQDSHLEIVAMTDEEFRARIGDVLHYACIVGWIRELDPDQFVADTGIVHRLVHVLTRNDDPGELAEIRQQVADLAAPDGAEIRDILAWKGVKCESTAAR